MECNTQLPIDKRNLWFLLSTLVTSHQMLLGVERGSAKVSRNNFYDALIAILPLFILLARFSLISYILQLLRRPTIPGKGRRFRGRVISDPRNTFILF